MSFFITNFQSPLDLDELQEFQKSGYGSNLSSLLEDSEYGTEWSVPSDAAPFDVVFFMCAATSTDSRHMAGVRKQAKLSGDQALIDLAEAQYTLHKTYAGKILAVGLVEAEPEAVESGDGNSRPHWFSRIYPVILLENPIDISEFRDFIMVSRTGAITKLDDIQYDALIHVIVNRNSGFSDRFAKAKEELQEYLDDSEDDSRNHFALSPIPYFSKYLELIFGVDELWEYFQYYVHHEFHDQPPEFFAFHRSHECVGVWRQMLDNMGGGIPLSLFASAAFLLLAYKEQGHDLDAELHEIMNSLIDG